MSEASNAQPQSSPVEPRGRVSVVIPTVNRPQEVRRAVRSALNQSVAPLEVVVAHDGVDQAAVAGLAQMDPRVRVIEVGPHPKNAGSSARNAGVAAARGDWIAFLDDDDEWLPGKLEAQLAAVRTDDEHLILAGRAERRSGRGSVVWPLRAPRRGERIGDYLFVRDHAGEGWLPTPVLMVPTALARQVPFDEALQQHEDLDWLLRLEARGARLEVVPDTVAVVHYDDSGNSLSGTGTWRGALAWAHLRRAELGETAFGAFCLTEVPRHIRQSSKFAAVVAIVRAAASGHSRNQEWYRFVATMVLPEGIANRLRTLRDEGLEKTRIRGQAWVSRDFVQSFVGRPRAVQLQSAKSRMEARMTPSEFALYYDDTLQRPTPYSVNNDYVGKARDRIERTFRLVEDDARGGVVADVGASPFYLLFLCQSAGASEAHGIYFSYDSHPLREQKYIHSTYGPIELSHCNVEREKLDLPDASVDVLTACEIFEHFDEFPAHFCGEILRVLRPGGTLAITVPNVCSLGNIAKLLLQRNIYMKYRSDTTGRHKHEFTMSQLRDLVRYLGLEEVDYGFFPSPTSDKFYLRPFYRAMAALPLVRRYSPNLYIKARMPHRVPNVDLEAYPVSLFDRSSSIEE